MGIQQFSSIGPKAVYFFVVLSLFVGFNTACSSKKENVIEPAKLERFSQTIKLRKLWQTKVGVSGGDQYVSVRPVLSEGVIYAGDIRGRLVALSPEDGEPIWRVRTGDEIGGGIGAGYGMVVYGTREGFAVALDAKNGAELWRQELSSEVLAAPQVSGDRVVIQTSDDHVYGLERESGERVWVYDTNIPVLTLRGTSDPIIYRNIVLAGFANGKLVALNLEDGIPGWEKQVSIPAGRSELERIVDLDGQFIERGGIVYAATYQGKIAAIDILSGRLIWQRDMSSYGGVAGTVSSLFVPDADGIMWAFDSDTGAQIWQQKKLEARKLTPPAMVDDFIVVGDFQGYVHWISTIDGEFAARVRVDDKAIKVNPIVKGDVAYVLGNSGNLVALQLAEKHILPKQTVLQGKRRFRRSIE